MPVLTYLWIIPLLPLLGRRRQRHFWRPLAEERHHGRRAFLDHAGLSRRARSWCANSLRCRRTRFPGSNPTSPGSPPADFSADFALQVDQLTVIMLLVVTGVGWLIHIYSTGYMHDDPGYRRFFAYLNLFMFFMLMLVLAANYLLMFVGWEGVGLCSYLLIGFWFLKKSATNAGNKAFWVNRIGDFGFLLGAAPDFPHLRLARLRARVSARRRNAADPAGQIGMLTAIALLLFVGATGKSAQLPLYVWLPDAMEGPTPVSALIHAATMVTAGVYMVVRSHAIFLNAPVAMQVVGIIGCADGAFCGHDWPGANRHQESARLLHRFASSATCFWPAAWARLARAFFT